MTYSTASDASRNFAKLLRQVENGERVTITRDGRPVAILSPVGDTDGSRERARERMMDLLRRGIPIGFTGGVDRNDIHGR